MTDGMDKYWIIPKVEDKELPRVDHQLASCSLLNSYVLILIIPNKPGDLWECGVLEGEGGREDEIQ